MSGRLIFSTYIALTCTIASTREHTPSYIQKQWNVNQNFSKIEVTKIV